MASYSTNEFRAGLTIMIDGDPYVIVENEFVKPGKGQAFTRTKMKNLITGNVVERTYKSGEKLDEARIDENEMVFNRSSRAPPPDAAAGWIWRIPGPAGRSLPRADPRTRRALCRQAVRRTCDTFALGCAGTL